MNITQHVHKIDFVGSGFIKRLLLFYFKMLNKKNIINKTIFRDILNIWWVEIHSISNYY